MNFNAYQHLTIKEATIELIDSSGGSGLIQKRSHKRKIFEEGAIFYESDK